MKTEALEQINEEYKLEVSRHYKQFKNMGITQEEYRKIVAEELQKQSCMLPIEEFIKKLDKKIFKMIKQSLSIKEKEEIFLTNYITENFQDLQDEKAMMRRFHVLNLLIENSDYIPDQEIVIELMKKNRQFYESIELIWNRHHNQIASGDFEGLYQSGFLIFSIEAFCELNHMEITLQENTKDEDVFETSIKEIDSYEMLQKEIREIPLLSLEEEKELTRKAYQQDENAKKALLEHNLRFVSAIAKKYEHKGLDFLDLFQEGCLGLRRGIDKFNPNKGRKLVTYTGYWIHQSIRRAIQEQSRNIRRPVHAIETMDAYKKTYSKLEAELDHAPKRSEIARIMNIEEEKLEEILKNCNRTDTVSINLPIGSDTGEDKIELEEFIGDSQPSVEDTVINHTLKDEMTNWLGKSNLSPRELDILKLIYGLDNKPTQTLERIGEKYHVSRQRIDQIRTNALQKLLASDYAKEVVSYTDHPEKALQKIKNHQRNNKENGKSKKGN